MNHHKACDHKNKLLLSLVSEELLSDVYQLVLNLKSKISYKMILALACDIDNKATDMDFEGYTISY